MQGEKERKELGQDAQMERDEKQRVRGRGCRARLAPAALTHQQLS